jgi:putative hydrolase of the HAD superfamily
LALSAVIFDYGIVLTGPPNAEAWAAMQRITGLPEGRFTTLFWANRHALDEGKLTGIAFWQKLLSEAGLPQNQEMVAELNRWDQRLWTEQNPPMIAWQLVLKQQGLRTAILSNISDNVLESVERAFDWIHRFDVLVWSYQLGMAKPDPEIYRYTLDKLGVQPAETLFIDDKIDNVEAAQALGIQILLYTSVEQLRADLIAAGLDSELPLPAVE